MKRNTRRLLQRNSWSLNSSYFHFSSWKHQIDWYLWTFFLGGIWGSWAQYIPVFCSLTDEILYFCFVLIFSAKLFFDLHWTFEKIASWIFSKWFLDAFKLENIFNGTQIMNSAKNLPNVYLTKVWYFASVPTKSIVILSGKTSKPFLGLIVWIINISVYKACFWNHNNSKNNSG